MWRSVAVMTIIFVSSVGAIGCTSKSGRTAEEPIGHREAAVEQAVGQPVAVVAEAQQVRPMWLWRVDGPNGPSFLFGTMHIGVDAQKDVPDVVWATLAGSSTVIMEMDVAEILANTGELLKFAALPPGQSLDQILTPAQWSALVQYLDGAFPEAALKRMKPWFVTLMIQRKALPSDSSIDLEVLDRARKGSKNVVFLEDWREALHMVDQAMPVELFAARLTELDAAETELRAMAEAYLAGDFGAVARETFDAATSDPAAAHSLELTVYRRNRAWMDVIESAVKEGDAFIAVGGGHLLGDASVVALLKERGYTVTHVE